MKYAPAISLALSVVLAIVGFLVWRGGERDPQAASAQPAAAAAAPAIATRSVLVARAEVETGERLEPGMVELREWPAQLVPDGALDTEDGIYSPNGERLLAQGHIFPGEPILSAKLAVTPPRRKLSQEIENGLRAVSIAVTSETGVSGFVLPGDWVDILAYERVPGGRDHKAYKATPLVRRVEVLAADHVFGNEAEGALPSSFVTLALSFEQARKVTAAARETRLGLALIGLEEILNEAGRDVAETDTPAQPAKSRARRVTMRASRPTPRPKAVDVKVVHGTSVDTVTTPVSPSEPSAGADS